MDLLGAGLCVPLVKCLIPKNKLDNNELESMILYWLADHNVLPVTVSTHILQWFIGLWEYQLSDRQLINTYYDCFFYYLLKRERTVRMPWSECISPFSKITIAIFYRSL